MGLLAGLGVGGLAVALAIRPTLENLIGGAILYIDRPVKLGGLLHLRSLLWHGRDHWGEIDSGQNARPDAHYHT